MKQKVSRFLMSEKSSPLILALLVVVSYGLVTPFIGFFMDDWYLIWFKHIFGGLKFIQYFSLDRPLEGYFYTAVNFLLGNSESAFLWQVFGLFIRWLCVFALWGFLNTLWPNAKKQNMLVCVLAAVFPGFLQQWIAMSYSFHLACLAGLFFSFTLMLNAVRNPKKFWLYIIPSYLIGFYCYAAAEFYYGLELIRPVILFIEFSRTEPVLKTRIKRTLKWWLPFFGVYILFGIWRAFFFVSKNHEMQISQHFTGSPLSVITDLFGKIYQAGVDATAHSWFTPLNLSNYPDTGIVPVIILAVILVVFIAIYLWCTRTYKDEGNQVTEQTTRWRREAFWLALISMIVAVLPFWAADLPISNQYPFDRFLLPYLFGSCLFIVVFSDKSKFGLLLISFLAAVAVGFHIRNGIRYKNMWDQQVDFIWQLTWRAPGIIENTGLISDELPFSDLFSAPSLTAPLNMIYDSDQSTNETKYMLFLFVQQRDVIQAFIPGETFDHSFRGFDFQGNTSNLLVFDKPAEGCLRILTPSDSVNSEEYWPEYEFWFSATPLSNLERIITETDSPAIPPSRFFGVENTDQWCYYYEKADLARQQKNWDEVIARYDEGFAKGYQPLNQSEWLPLIEAYLQIGAPEKALEITKGISGFNSEANESFCNLWATIKESASNSEIIRELQEATKCDILHD